MKILVVYFSYLTIYVSDKYDYLSFLGILIFEPITSLLRSYHTNMFHARIVKDTPHISCT